MSKATIYCNEQLIRWREAKSWVVYKRNADGSIGAYLKIFHGRLARFRSWWYVAFPHVLDPPPD